MISSYLMSNLPFFALHIRHQCSRQSHGAVELDVARFDMTGWMLGLDVMSWMVRSDAAELGVVGSDAPGLNMPGLGVVRLGVVRSDAVELDASEPDMP